jgi:hypothetical protein
VSSTYADRHSSCGEIRRLLHLQAAQGIEIALARRTCPPLRACSSGRLHARRVPGWTPGPSSLRTTGTFGLTPATPARAVRVARPVTEVPGQMAAAGVGPQRAAARTTSSRRRSAVRIRHLCQHTEPATGVDHRREARTVTVRCLGGNCSGRSDQRPLIGPRAASRPRPTSGHEGTAGLYTADDIQTSDPASLVAGPSDCRRGTFAGCQYRRSMGGDMGDHHQYTG